MKKYISFDHSTFTGGEIFGFNLHNGAFGFNIHSYRTEILGNYDVGHANTVDTSCTTTTNLVNSKEVLEIEEETVSVEEVMADAQNNHIDSNGCNAM